MLWSDAKLCILLGRLDLFRRRKDVLAKYEEYQNSLKRNNIQVKDVILRKMKGHPIAWMKNEFPYDVENATHYLIWSTTPLSDDKIQEIATRHSRGREFICFVNPEHLKSIPEIFHAHVFMKNL